MQKYGRTAFIGAFAASLLGGCGVLEPGYEAAQREAVGQVGAGLGLEPFTEKNVHGELGNAHGELETAHGQLETAHGQLNAAALPQLDAGALPQDYLRFALLHHPRVQGAFYRWWQQVERITPARSLPDPVLTFQADITDMVMSLMPGIMMDIPGWGKLEAAGLAAAAGAEVLYREYVLALYETAAQLRGAWAQLQYSAHKVALAEQTLAALEQSVVAVAVQYGTSAEAVSLQAQVAAMDATARATVVLQDRREALAAAQARFKSALGLRRGEPDPHWPQAAFSAGAEAGADALWERVLTDNPRLAVFHALAQAALAQVDVAGREGNPDFAAGLMVDVKPNPLMFRPEFAMSLPVWRDKIAAVLAAAQAGSLAAQASLREAELELAAEFAQVLAALRRSERQLDYLQTHALPNAERALLSADVDYRSGSGDFGTLVALRLVQLQLREERAAAERDHALGLAELSMLGALSLPDDGLVINSSK